MIKRGRPSQRDWVSTTVMARELGCSPNSLLRNRQYFTPGKDWKILNPFAYRKTYRWNRINITRAMEHETPQSS
jgi:hypothetical protein